MEIFYDRLARHTRSWRSMQSSHPKKEIPIDICINSQSIMDNQAIPSNHLLGKKAAHVKWAGKTIALGTFTREEAEEKCSQAKALTRAWRTTMRPRPSREWVINELERCGVRYVVGRSGKDKDDVGFDDQFDEDHLFEADDDEDDGESVPDAFPKVGTHDNGRQESSLISSIDSGKQYQVDSGPKRDGAQQRRNASSGIALLGNFAQNSKASLGHDQVIPPPHRPLVGGGAAAAYEVARADHYMKLAAQKKTTNNSVPISSTQPVTAADKTANNARVAALEGTPRLSFLQQNPSPTHAMNSAQPISEVQAHYEILKIHHINLLKEVQETTIMLNIYQQQLLIQQQEKMNEELLKKQQLKKKQQMAATRPLDAVSKADSSKKFMDGTRIMDSGASTNHGFVVPTFMGAVDVPRASVKQVNNRVRKSNDNSMITGEGESPRVKRLHFEQLKAEILEKQAMLEAMAQDMGPSNKDNETNMLNDTAATRGDTVHKDSSDDEKEEFDGRISE